MRTLHGTVLALALMVALVGCESHPTAVPPAMATSSPASAPGTLGCPVTAPGAAGPSAGPPGLFFGADSSYGNGSLRVGGLGPNGVIVRPPEFVSADGTVGWKFGWWRAVPGTLQITGRRLDGPAEAARAQVPSGYGDLGFQSSGVYFPTTGCWEVTGQVGPSRLTFVTLVRGPAVAASPRA